MTTDSSTRPAPSIEWATAITFAITTAVAVIAVPIYGYFFGFSTTAWVAALLLWIACGISIGSGYHRLWSHRTYEAHWLLRVFFALGGALALQNSALVWCARHRVHHKHVDEEDADPHSIKLGFWYAHIGWMLRDYEPGRVDFSRVRDLERDPIVAWQHRHYWALTWSMNLGLPAVIGLLAGDLWGVILLAGFLRLVVNHQVTFMVNSLAHMWGKRPYSEENTARDNWFLAILTFGEGYHNFHHAFQADYRNGARWWQFDINKWFLNICRLFGLCRNFKVTPQFRILRAKLNIQFERARARISESDGWKETLDREYQQFRETVVAWQALQRERVKQTRQSLKARWESAELRSRMQELEFSLKLQRKRLREIMSALPAPQAA